MLPTELHPLEPFLPENARLLMLGSFPPQRRRWSMDFYYPNLQNDMWRIFGMVFFGESRHFLADGGRAFDRERIVSFLSQKGIALYDTAVEVRRLQDNASDKFLEVVREADFGALLGRLPLCRAIVTTGEKATGTICGALGAGSPRVGGHTDCTVAGRALQLWRMPSSSRAYPMALDKKAALYALMFRSVFGE